MKYDAMKNYDVILFDLDATLTDSSPGIINSIIYALNKYGIIVSKYFWKMR